MRKVLFLMLIFIITSFFSACKSTEIQNVEKMIDSIGIVSLVSENIIISAEDAYATLSDADKASVKNFNILLEARAELNKLLIEKKLIGDWIWVRDGLRLTLNADGTSSSNEYLSKNWTYSPDNNTVTIGNNIFEVKESDKIIELYPTTFREPDDTLPFIKENQIGAKVKKVAITTDNWQDYFEFVYTPVLELDDWEEALDFYPLVQLQFKKDVSYCYSINNTANTVLVDFEGTDAMLEVTWNEVLKSCQFNIKDKELVWGASLEKPQKSKMVISLKEFMGYSLEAPFARRGHSDLNKQQCTDIIDYKVSRAKGYIYVYERTR